MALAVINAPEPIQTTPQQKGHCLQHLFPNYLSHLFNVCTCFHGRALFSDGEHGKKLTPKRKTLASKVKKTPPKKKARKSKWGVSSEKWAVTLVSFVVYDWPNYCILHGLWQLLCCKVNSMYSLLGTPCSWEHSLLVIFSVRHSNYLISFAQFNLHSKAVEHFTN